MKKGITAHIIIKNEEQWIWYAIQSVLNSMDSLIIYDTGSTDKTIELIQSIKSKKIISEEKGNVSRESLVDLRNEMLKKTNTDWFLVVDGDDIWTKKAIALLTKSIEKTPQGIWGIVVRTRNCVGDVWHYQPESAGRYQLLGRKGHLTIRAYRKLPGFKWKGEYPLEAYCDQQTRPINNQKKRLKFVDAVYWHLTHLHRSSKSNKVIDRSKKHKLEIGIKARKDELPEVFFSKRPEMVPSPWIRPSIAQKITATALTPMRRLKRRLEK